MLDELGHRNVELRFDINEICTTGLLLDVPGRTKYRPGGMLRIAPVASTADMRLMVSAL